MRVPTYRLQCVMQQFPVMALQAGGLPNSVLPCRPSSRRTHRTHRFSVCAQQNPETKQPDPDEEKRKKPAQVVLPRRGLFAIEVGSLQQCV